ncbi:hypothetical protein SYNPS1DRAFT_29858 [Syncephalis pseudoplumigaleata]|uniref:Uncharacterized protein n=1 Tax=Syncephalis pseudoplumigaleata TaxID=1712513 RepID=A0A4V1J1A4_9FUNG|nr:hypothetical protein SYNPS1DRAFT_29858 [Syncephalis pseudoplumigaleata]|eukprot:RKP24369.1 hypothetical protein SYNPS1DRAFT_29858 [Syncephalis pseudoplumigaleata]
MDQDPMIRSDGRLFFFFFCPATAAVPMTTRPAFEVGHAPDLLAHVPYPLQRSCTMGAAVDGPAYVYDVHDMGGQLLAVTTSADHHIHLYDKARLAPTAQLVHHKNTVQGLQRVRSTDHLLLSCGEDGVVALWDVRQPSHTPSQVYTGTRQAALFALDQTDALIAAGTDLIDCDAYVLFW